MKQRIFFTVILITAAIIACNKNNDTSIPDTSSNISVFNAVPGVNFDILVDTATIGTNIGLGENTGYHSFRAQRYDLHFFVNGNHTDTISGGQISLRNNHSYTLYVSQDHNNNLRLLTTEDNLAVPASKTANFRVIDLSDSYDTLANAVTLDFWIGGTIYFSRLSYQAVSRYVNLPSGSVFNRNIRLGGDSTLSLLGNIDSTFTLQDQKIHTWVLYGNALKADSFKLTEIIH